MTGPAIAQARRLAVAYGRLGWAVLACLLVASAAWMLTSVPELPPERDHDAWRLPALPGAAAKESWAALAERNIWGATETPAQGAATQAVPARPLTPPDWRILAAVVTAKERVVVVRIGAEYPQELRIGDALPGGAIIREIEPDRLVVQIDGRRRILRVPPR